MLHRYLSNLIATDLRRKVVLISGARQAGKTTLARGLIASFSQGQYLNWDVFEDRTIIQRRSWNAASQLLIFDEIHKMPDWKNWLKGLSDARRPDQGILVTGSARLDTFRQSGASLAGRYFAYRLHPLSVAELCRQQNYQPQPALERLLERGGFPEPCLADSTTEAERWRRQYFTDLVREDILDFARLREIKTMRLFLQMLRSRVGSPLSLANIAHDLAVSSSTLKNYLEILEALHIIFTIRPWHRKITRALSRRVKVYFYDTGLVLGDHGARLENLLACALLKHIEFLQDIRGADTQLHYLRTKDGAELNFVIAHDQQAHTLIECKASASKPGSALKRFARELQPTAALQLVANLRQPQSLPAGIEVRPLAPWLAQLEA